MEQHRHQRAGAESPVLILTVIGLILTVVVSTCNQTQQQRAAAHEAARWQAEEQAVRERLAAKRQAAISEQLRGPADEVLALLDSARQRREQLTERRRQVSERMQIRLSEREQLLDRRRVLTEAIRDLSTVEEVAWSALATMAEERTTSDAPPDAQMLSAMAGQITAAITTADTVLHVGDD